MRRQIIALIVGVSFGCLLGRLLGLTSYPFLSVSHSELWLSRIFAMWTVGFLTGGVTSLISWKHTPGLPGMAYSLAIATLGLTARRQPVQEDFLVSATIESMLLLGGLLLTYMAAWTADTQVVFRTLAVKPTPKQVNSKLLLTKLLPCALITAVGGIALLLPIPVIISAPLAFGLTGFIAAKLFQSRSTLWYSAAVPCFLAALGLIVLSSPPLGKLALTPLWRQNASFTICGLGSAGAIIGHWCWVKQLQKQTVPERLQA